LRRGVKNTRDEGIESDIMITTTEAKKGIDILGQIASRHRRILTPEALKFFAELQREFNPRRLELLAKRAERQREINRGEMPDFLRETRAIREGDWKVDPVPADLQDRRVEITPSMAVDTQSQGNSQ